MRNRAFSLRSGKEANRAIGGDGSLFARSASRSVGNDYGQHEEHTPRKRTQPETSSPQPDLLARTGETASHKAMLVLVTGRLISSVGLVGRATGARAGRSQRRPKEVIVNS